MASIERTAYPRFRHDPNASELQEWFTPRDEEINLAQSQVRGDEPLVGFLLLLKCVQHLGYFPLLSEIPASVCNHVRGCLRLPVALAPTYEEPRTARRHQSAIREHLRLKASHSREATGIAARAVHESAQVLDGAADLINVAVERLRAQQCELPSFATLDRMVNRVRNVVHKRVFRQVVGKLTPPDVERLDSLLKTTGVTQRQTAFQGLKEAPKRPSLTHLDLLLDHQEWLESLGEAEGPLSGISPALVQHFAIEAKALYAGELREVRAPKQYTLLLCLIHQMFPGKQPQSKGFSPFGVAALLARPPAPFRDDLGACPLLR